MDNRNRVFALSGPIGRGRLDERTRDKLKSANLEQGSDRVAPAARLAERLGVNADTVSYAATRFLGEQGRFADGWVAAADPVYLEPRLDHLCLIAQKTDADELGAIVAHLNDTLAGDGIRFEIEGSGAYLRADRPMSTSNFPTQVIDGLLPNKYLPADDGANDFRKLLAEIEMSLHEHPVNQSRQARGLRPVNSLWLWGGGQIDEREAPCGLPSLASEDATLRGLWTLFEGEICDSIDSALTADGSCVVDIGDEPDTVSRLLDLKRPLTLFSRDGLTIDASGSGSWRFWQRRHAELEPDA